MRNTELLIKHLNAQLERATDIDENGIEFWKDLHIPACDLQDLKTLVDNAQKELESKEWDDLLGMLKARISSSDFATGNYWRSLNSQPELSKELFDAINKLYHSFKDWFFLYREK